ncbi:InlB B-repeat-containing protein [Finegoldia magna]|uniref:InlB B-repeat-containing protein n=1 Tax=Finegoldia magna TaxID=1260 RepID=UPI001F4F5D90|nr:InlB B-repeat-containing protein [Finegoldia magna]
MDNYVKVTFKAGKGGSVSGDLVYYVSPEVEVNMTSQAEDVTKKPSIGYTSNGGTWSPEIKSEKITTEKTYEFNFVKSKDIVEKTGDEVKKPKGYVTVKFIAGENGEVVGADEKIYYVNPTAGIKLGKAETPDKKTLVVPTTKPNENYVFQGWQEPIDETNPITNDRTHVAIFKSGQVTLTYAKGGDDVTGDVPKTVTVNHGTSVVLAGKGKLAKPNAEFAGWKLDEDETIYQPGDQVKLEKARTATAQWTAAKHKVIFDTQGGSKVDSQQVEHGNTATEPKSPTQDGKVFMGWKEKESDENYFNFNTQITADKTLIAIWQDPVQKIDEKTDVESQFIKVTFNEGKHGTLKDGKTESAEKVTYKVAKGLKFADAVKAGMTVPAIAPAKYYKAKSANDGWDKKLELNGQNVEFTAQYEPQADVIPVDPKVTDEEQIKKETPEGMVLVEFKVSDDSSFYIPKNAKYYVKKETEVRVQTPVVLEKTTDTVFNGWQDVNLVEEAINPTDKDPKAKKFIWVKQSFNEDTVISDEKTFDIKLIITKPSAGDKRIYIEQMSDNSKGKIELIRNGNVIESVENKKFRRRRKEYNVFDFNNELQSGDLIRYWQESSTKISDYTTEHIN